MFSGEVVRGLFFTGTKVRYVGCNIGHSQNEVSDVEKCFRWKTIGGGHGVGLHTGQGLQKDCFKTFRIINLYYFCVFLIFVHRDLFAGI